MSDRRCSHCGAQLPRHYTPGTCPGDPALARLAPSPAVRLVTPPVRDESVEGAFLVASVEWALRGLEP